MSAAAGLALPTRWPSAWPDLWPGVLMRAAFPLSASLLTLAGLGWLGDLSLSWWIPLLPAVLLISPLRRPGRVRRGFDRAAAAGRLRVADGPDGLIWGVTRNVAAAVDAEGAVHYLDGARRR